MMVVMDNDGYDMLKLQSRTNNIIKHGVAEDEDDDREADKHETIYATTLFENIKVPVVIKSVARIGVRADDKKRPNKVYRLKTRKKKFLF